MLRRCLVLLVTVFPALTFAWGFDGHRRLASLMQDPLPAGHCLKQWYVSKQTTTLQDSSCDPDRWRYTSAGSKYDPNEWPRHYLEIDYATPPSSYPRRFSDVQAEFRNYADDNGLVPWRVEEMYWQLVNAFKAKNETEILRLSFLFSHYVTDAFSILHNTKNFDPNGLHSRWESDMLQSNANLNALTNEAKTFYGTLGKADPRNNIFDVVIVGNGLVATLIQADTQNDAGIPGLFAATKTLTARRWGDALTLLSSMLWSAWTDAGKPDLGFTNGCSTLGASGEISLTGYPVPGGFTHPDAGEEVIQPPPPKDSGVDEPDAAVEEVDGGADEVDGGETGNPEEPMPTCGCQANGALSFGLFTALVLILARRR